MCGTGISRERQTGCSVAQDQSLADLFGTVVQKNGGKGRVRHGIEGKNEQEMRSHSRVLSQRTCNMKCVAVADFGDVLAAVKGWAIETAGTIDCPKIRAA